MLVATPSGGTVLPIESHQIQLQAVISSAVQNSPDAATAASPAIASRSASQTPTVKDTYGQLGELVNLALTPIWLAAFPVSYPLAVFGAARQNPFLAMFAPLFGINLWVQGPLATLIALNTSPFGSTPNGAPTTAAANSPLVRNSSSAARAVVAAAAPTAALLDVNGAGPQPIAVTVPSTLDDGSSPRVSASDSSLLRLDENKLRGRSIPRSDMGRARGGAASMGTESVTETPASISQRRTPPAETLPSRSAARAGRP